MRDIFVGGMERRKQRFFHFLNFELKISTTPPPIYPIPVCPWHYSPGTLHDFDAELRSFYLSPLFPRPMSSWHPSLPATLRALLAFPSAPCRSCFADTPLEVSRPILGAY